MGQDARTVREQMSVLLVEDSSGDAELIAMELACADEVTFQLTRACRLSEAMELLQTQPFQLVLLDLGLPDSQGMGTFELARAAASHTPFIVLTGRVLVALVVLGLGSLHERRPACCRDDSRLGSKRAGIASGVDHPEQERHECADDEHDTAYGTALGLAVAGLRASHLGVQVIRQMVIAVKTTCR